MTLNARNFTQSILVKTNGSEEEKTGQVTLNGMDLILWAIENDCHMLLKLIISNIGVDVDKQMLSRACTVVQGRTIGSPWTIKFLVDRVLHQTDETGFFFLEEDRDRVKSQRDKYHLSKRQHTMLIELLEKLEVLENVTLDTMSQNKIYVLQNEIDGTDEGRQRNVNLCVTLGLSDVLDVWWRFPRR